jgi:hypothetical protein
MKRESENHQNNEKRASLAKTGTLTTVAPAGLLTDLRELILTTRRGVATTVNSALTMLHWQIGLRIRQDILRERRAEYGEQIVSALGTQLTQEFGRGFGRRNLFNMVRFAEVYPDPAIVQSMIAQLGWTHFLHIIRLDDPLQRDFYGEMCRLERWSTRTLEKKIAGMLFERTALSKKPAKLIVQELRELHVATYWTDVLPKKELERKLHETVRLARANLAARRLPESRTP